MAQTNQTDPETPGIIIGEPTPEVTMEGQPEVAPAPVVEVPVEPVAPEQPAPAIEVPVEQAPVEPAPLEVPVQQVEQAPAPEIKTEQAATNVAVEKTAVEQTIAAQPPAVEQAPVTKIEKDERLVQIENLLADKLDEAVAELAPEQQPVFIKAAENAALRVFQILFADKVSEHDLIKILEDWFKTAKGLDPHYLNQVIKIKVDELLDYRKDMRGSI